MTEEDPVLGCIKNGLIQAKIKSDKEAEKFAQEAHERELKENARLQKEKIVKEEIDKLKIFLMNLARDILGIAQIAEWRNPGEEDCGENYFAIIKDEDKDIRIKLWSDDIGIEFIPLSIDQVQTIVLARMIKRRLEWIKDNAIEPVVKDLT